MAWLRIDDRVRTHPKIIDAGPAAAWFWFCGICYCREHLTDGFIAKAVLPTLAPGVTKTAPLVAGLIRSGLWHESDGGYQVHDFLDWNPSRETVIQKRKEDVERKRNPNGFQSDSERNPDGLQTTIRARAGARARAISGSSDNHDRFSRTTLHPRRHPDLMTVGPVELWASQFAQLVTVAMPSVGGDRERAETEVREWVSALDDELLTAGASAEDIKHPRKFWQERAADKFGRTSPAAAKVCRHHHQPPCATDAECTRKYHRDMEARARAEA